jgi:predicted metalloprotease
VTGSKRRVALAGLVLLTVVLGGCSARSRPAAPDTTPGSVAPATTAPAPAPTSAGSSAPPPAPEPSDEAAQLPGFPSPTASPTLPAPTSAAAVRRFVAAVFTDAQSEWSRAFAAAGIAYRPARLVLFSSAVRTGCGTETSEVGPFYCPADHTVYLDTAFFAEMERRYGVRGDFAMAYVVAHEVGHHIQAITGLTAQVAGLQQANPALANVLSVRTELQADCYAGVWAHSTYVRDLLEPGDLTEALTAAAVVGDDFQQRVATGTVAPEQWTHGSSAQRQHWLTTGFTTGRPSRCDTFAA